MNRRTVLRGAVPLVAAGLAGCLDDEGGFPFEVGFESPIPIEIHSEVDRHYNVLLEAHEPETGRESYDQAYAVVPEESITAPSMDPRDQRLRVTLFRGEAGADVEDADGDEGAIDEVDVDVDGETRLVIVRIREDGLVVEVDP